jgi:hypothetical protein
MPVSEVSGGNARGPTITPPADERPIPKLDPAKPTAILAPQYGRDPGDRLVENGAGYLEKQLAQQGYNVIDAANLSKDDLRIFVARVAKANPRAFERPFIAFTSGHGSVVRDEDTAEDRHMISASPANNLANPKRYVETVADVLKPVYDGVRDGIGRDPKMAAFVSSCRSGEAAKDVDRMFPGNPNIGIVTSSSREELSTGSSQAEQSLLAYARMLSRQSRERATADVNGDGDVSIREMADFWNTQGGGLAGIYDSLSTPESAPPNKVVLGSQRLEVGGNASLPLIPTGSGTGRVTWRDGMTSEALRLHFLNEASAPAVAKEIASHADGMAGLLEFDPTRRATRLTEPDGSKAILADGSLRYEWNRTLDQAVVRETRRTDGSREIMSKEGTRVEITPSGLLKRFNPKGSISETTFDPRTGDYEALYRNNVREHRRGDGSGHFTLADGSRLDVPVPQTGGIVRMATDPEAQPIPFSTRPSIMGPMLEGMPTQSKDASGRRVRKWPDGTLSTEIEAGLKTTYPSTSPVVSSTINMRDGSVSHEMRSGPLARITVRSGEIDREFRNGAHEVRREDGSGYFEIGGQRIVVPIEATPPQLSRRRPFQLEEQIQRP